MIRVQQQRIKDLRSMQSDLTQKVLGMQRYFGVSFGSKVSVFKEKFNLAALIKLTA